jgi:predicted hydrocarbon binding protein
MGNKKIILFFDPKKGELYFNNVSSVIDMRVDIVRFQHGVEKILGNATKGMMYNAAKNAALRCYGIMYDSMLSSNENLARKEFVVHCLEEFKRVGFGVAELKEYDKEGLSFVVNVANSFNTDGYKKTRSPVCHILAGKLAAIFEVAFGMEMSCEETACEAVKGHGCTFMIKSEDRKAELSLTGSDKKFVLSGLRGLEKTEMEYDDRGKVFLQGNSSVIDFREYWSIYQHEFEKIIGPATKAIVYDVSKQGTFEAMSLVMRYVIKVARMISTKKIIEEILKQIPMRGYGRITNYSFDDKKKTGVVRMKNCFNAVGYNGKASKPVCYSMAGNIAGAGKIIFGSDVVCTERKCEGKGDDYCEFVVKPA